MKQMARKHCWWPSIDKDIKSLSRNCHTCRSHADAPPREFSSWPESEKPWERIHVDFAGSFLNKMWLIVVDSFSKFPFVVPLLHATASTTIIALQNIFGLEGLPLAIVSNNGTQFTSAEFEVLPVEWN